LESNKETKHIPSSSPPLRTSQGSWAHTNITKAQVFANHLTSVFQLHPSKKTPGVDESLTSLLESPYQLDLPPQRFKYSEIQTVINNLSPKTSPGYDLITDRILQELPPNGIKYITHLFNVSFLIGYFPNQWKVAQIILLLKPGKPPNDPSSYRPISLLPMLLKIFEKLIFRRLLPIIEK
jgi:hypothetical protein